VSILAALLQIPIDVELPEPSFKFDSRAVLEKAEPFDSEQKTKFTAKYNKELAVYLSLTEKARAERKETRLLSSMEMFSP
jgi:hypothetical protein